MATHVQDFILNIFATLAIQTGDFVLESLPLGLFVFRIVFAVSIVRSVDETKVSGSLWIPISLSYAFAENALTYIIECGRNGLRIILKEEACDGSVIDVRRRYIRLSHSDHGKYCHKEKEPSRSHVHFVTALLSQVSRKKICSYRYIQGMRRTEKRSIRGSDHDAKTQQIISRLVR